jgi:C1A family cysteine protease
VQRLEDSIQAHRKDAAAGVRKEYLDSGIPSMFGFYGFPSFESCDVKGGIPYPCPGEKAQWGHAIVEVGYDDANQWFIVRNSWGAGWGIKGYFTLPYAYLIDENLSDDFWTIRIVE